MKAYKLFSKGNAAVADAPKPALRPDCVLVKVAYVALNPTDWKHIKATDVPEGTTPLTVGCDFAGMVEEVGVDVTRPLRPGDRVCGFLQGTNLEWPDNGSFAEYLVVKADLVLEVPSHMSFPEAATLGVQVYTVGQGLYQSLGLPWPTEPLPKVADDEKTPILIYGGSTAMGTLGIQVAKLSGFKVITTCSPRNFDLVKALGADEVFDYSSPTVGSDIRAYTNNKLRYAWDTVGAEQVCADALSSEPSSEKHPIKYATIVRTPDNFPRQDVQTSVTIAYTVSGEPARVFGGVITLPARPEDFAFAKRWGATAARLFADKKVIPHPVEVRGGLQDITQGLKDLEEGRVSGKKLVYRVGDL
ncbi:putative zinc-binding oxidoreductase ToxD [Corynascus similis CBS 632.67]